MDELIKNAANIIEAASKSPLGIIALLILVLVVLYFRFYSTSSTLTKIFVTTPLVLFLGFIVFMEFLGTPVIEFMKQVVKTPSEVVRVREVDRALFEAVEYHDVNTLNRILAEEYTSTSPTGQIENKSDELRFAKSKYTIRFDSPQNTEIFVDGNSAKVSGYIRMFATVESRISSATFKYTNRYAKRQGNWQCVSNKMSVVGQ